ncbi:hypothetical protein FQA39_LY13646 [Lamprigera yunnana]|nr:hypothetical protein FQA39_LY13646 [Lamprigera yunnana]
MPGEVLNSQSQMFVIKLLKYFEEETESGGPLIFVLSVQQRVSDALSVSLGTVQNIMKRYIGNPILLTPSRSRTKRRRKTVDTLHEIKNLIQLSVYSIMKAMSRSQKIVELARKEYTESNPQSTWMASQSNFDDQLENLDDDRDRYEVESDSYSKCSDHHIKMLMTQ